MDPAASSLAPPTPRPPPAASRGRGVDPIHAAGVGTVLAMLLARAAVDGRILYPGCGFLWLTGRPCPGCGGTHALAALSRGDVTAALAGHPLVALIALGLVGLALVVALDRALNRGRGTSGLSMQLRRIRGIGWWVAGAVLANWCYLLILAE